jgi:predicted extracellular nuclease
VKNFVDQIRAINPLANVVLLGDLNDFEFSETVDILANDLFMLDLPRFQPPAERYTYVFDGNSQVLDHILISVPLALLGVGRTTSSTPTPSTRIRRVTTIPRSSRASLIP